MGSFCLFNFLFAFACLLHRGHSRRYDPFIIGGRNATVGQFPWQASLQLSYGKPFCGGVWIGKEWVLTAGHCVDGQNVDSIRVVMGITKQTESNNGYIYKVAGLIKHEDYVAIRKLGIPNDIALVKLTEPAKPVAKLVQPAKLPEGENDYEGLSCVISGWGYMFPGNYPTGLPNTLQFTKAVIMSKEDCKEFWGNIISDYHICVDGDGDSGACVKDSGGPLTSGDVLLGVTSFGESRCYTSFPSVYTRVSHYLGWIHRHTGIEPPH